MSTEVPTSYEELEQAAQEARADAEQAEQLLATLVERLRSGDEAVTVEELESAKSVAEFARFRAEGAATKAATAHTAARQQLFTDLDNAVKDALAPGATLHPTTEFDALSPADRNRLYIEDPGRYYALRDGTPLPTTAHPTLTGERP